MNRAAMYRLQILSLFLFCIQGYNQAWPHAPSYEVAYIKNLVLVKPPLPGLYGI